MKKYILFFCYNGVMIAIYSGFLEVVVRNCLNGQYDVTKELSNILIILGISKITGGYISGKLFDL